VVMRRRRLTEEEKERIIDYRKEGRSYTEISVLMGGLAISTIERYARTVKRGQIKTERQRPAVSVPQAPLVETPQADVLPPNQTIFPDWYHEVEDIVKEDYETPEDMFDAAAKVLPPLSDDERTLWMYAITVMWGWKRNNGKNAKFIQAFTDAYLLTVINRIHPEQLPQIIESMRRGDKILARLDEMILLLKELLKEMKRRER